MVHSKKYYKSLKIINNPESCYTKHELIEAATYVAAYSSALEHTLEALRSFKFTDPVLFVEGNYFMFSESNIDEIKKLMGFKL